jgi:hypothetical protein
MKATLLVALLSLISQCVSGEIRDVINHTDKYLGRHVDLVGIARVAGGIYLFPDESSAAALDLSNALRIRYPILRLASYRDLDREWVDVSGIISSEYRRGWYPGIGLMLERVQVLRDRPHPRIKADWVRAFFRNDTGRDLTIQLRTRSVVTAAFVLRAHQTREMTVEPSQREVFVLPDIGPFMETKGKILMRCQIDWDQLPPDYAYLAESSDGRRLYFDINQTRIEQVRTSEGRKWKVTVPLN